MKTLGIIPARYASSRFPGKPLVRIAGKSMIQRVYEACMACPQLDDVLVATDDERIHAHLVQIGAKVEMTSVEHLNGTERVAEVAERHPEMDCIINIQGDEPCLHPKQISTLISLMNNQKEIPIGTLVRKIAADEKHEIPNPNRVKAVIQPNSPVAADFIRDVKDGDATAAWAWHVGMYAFRREILLEIVQLSPSEKEVERRLEQLRWLDRGYAIGVAYTEYESPAVDVPKDVERVEAFLEKNR